MASTVFSKSGSSYLKCSWVCLFRALVTLHDLKKKSEENINQRRKSLSCGCLPGAQRFKGFIVKSRNKEKGSPDSPEVHKVSHIINWPFSGL